MKTIFIVIAIVVILVVVFFVGTGFQKRADVVLIDYSASEDGSEISLEVQATSSMGHIRGFKDNGGGSKPHYLTFYNAFGGVNSSLATVHTFELDINPADRGIYFNRPDGEYELILVKNEKTGQWLRPEKVEVSATYAQITAAEAKVLMDSEANYIILDVRTLEEFSESHIDGAILIPDYEILEKTEDILTDKGQLILVYCRSGRRSKLASENLVKLGYTNVKEFGGIIDWPYGTVN